MVQPIRVTAAGLRWEVLPECRERLLGPDGLRLAEWLRTGQARIVKQGAQRTVYRVTLPGLSFYLKHNRLTDLRAWLRELVRPAKARIEYGRALAVAARRVPTIVPLALGERRSTAGPGDSFLLTCTLEGTETVAAFLQTTLPTLAPARQVRLRQRVAVELGKLLARMHDAGIIHNDLHPGNLLIRVAADDRPELYLIDLHAVALSRPLAWPASLANLVLLNRWCVLRAARTDRLRFWYAYSQARLTANWWGGSRLHRVSAKPPMADMACELEERTWESNRRFWEARDQRCLVTNRYYQRLRSASAFGHAVRDLDRATLNGLLADPDAPFRQPGVRLLKDSRSSTVAEFSIPIDGVPRPVIYKRFRVTTWTDPWTALVRRTPALRSWVHGHGLRERCLPTARPLLVLHRRRCGLACEGYLLTEKIPGALDLHQYVDCLASLAVAQRRASLRHRIDQIARLVRELHRSHLAHRDLKAANVLLTGSHDSARNSVAWLIDLVGVTRHRQLSRGRRIHNLARLAASFTHSATLTRTDRLRFLREYLQWGLHGRGGWKSWWAQIEQAVQAKIARNARSGRPLS